MSENNSFTSHFIELRSRLIKSIIFIFIIFIISYTFAEYIYAFLVDPYAEAVKNDQTSRRLIFTALHETFITYLKVAFFSAIFLVIPIPFFPAFSPLAITKSILFFLIMLGIFFFKNGRADGNISPNTKKFIVLLNLMTNYLNGYR